MIKQTSVTVDSPRLIKQTHDVEVHMLLLQGGTKLPRPLSTNGSWTKQPLNVLLIPRDDVLESFLITLYFQIFNTSALLIK